MTFDNIIGNFPYGKIGCDITKKVIEHNSDSNYSMLGTRNMFKPFYKDILACAFVQIGRCELGSNKKLDWGVEQAILLATNGWTEVVDNRKKEGDIKVGIGGSPCNLYALTHLRTSYLVGVDRPQIDHTDNKNPNLRKGYIYVSFDTIEEACECAIDIVSWENPTDSHYRCVRWGFVCGLIPHCFRKTK